MSTIQQRCAGGICGVVILVALLVAIPKLHSHAAPRARVAREVAPAFTLYDAHGRPHTLDQMRGRVVLLNFWTTWCGACREEMPFLTQVHVRFAGQGLEVAAVSLDENPDVVGEFVREHRIGYPVFLPDKKTREAYADITAVPTLLMIDREGHIAARHLGYDSDADYAKEISGLLAESTRR